jgi:hypothetical protein
MVMYSVNKIDAFMHGNGVVQPSKAWKCRSWLILDTGTDSEQSGAVIRKKICLKILDGASDA